MSPSPACLWKQTKGLPYVSSAILYRGQYVMVKDGGIVTAYDATTGERAVPEAGRRQRAATMRRPWPRMEMCTSCRSMTAR